jgi:phosphate acetyltransferase
MESLTNVPFDEIRIGDSASVSRRLTQFEVEALALVAGDVDAFHIEEGEHPGRGDMHAESVGAEALLSGLLNRKLPGPGTSIVAQDLRFEGYVQVGDELVATVTAHEKHAEGGSSCSTAG